MVPSGTKLACSLCCCINRYTAISDPKGVRMDQEYRRMGWRRRMTETVVTERKGWEKGEGEISYSALLRL